MFFLSCILFLYILGSLVLFSPADESPAAGGRPPCNHRSGDNAETAVPVPRTTPAPRWRARGPVDHPDPPWPPSYGHWPGHSAPWILAGPSGSQFPGHWTDSPTPWACWSVWKELEGVRKCIQSFLTASPSASLNSPGSQLMSDAITAASMSHNRRRVTVLAYPSQFILWRCSYNRVNKIDMRL